MSLDDELKGARSQKSRLEKQRNAAERELKRCKELEEQLTELRKSRATLQKKSTEAAKRARSGELVLQRQVTSLRKLSGEVFPEYFAPAGGDRFCCFFSA